jgi:hypothetical protein
MNIRDLISTIPENSENEALLSIESIKLNPADNSATIRCHAANQFRMNVAINTGLVTISAEGRKSVNTSAADFVAMLKKTIYEIDESIAAGYYSQSAPKSCFILPEIIPPAPENMDLPTWDAEAKKWYDAEY